MIRLAICDDSRTDLDMISRYIELSVKKKLENCEILKYTNVERMLSVNEKEPFQIIFLDIMLGKTDGFEVARMLKQRNEKVLIVFITSNYSLVYNSFNYLPFGFIRKGEERELKNEIDKIIIRIQNDICDKRPLVFELSHNVKRAVACKEIVFISSNKNYLEIHLRNGEDFRVRGTLSNLEKQLEDTKIIRIGRMYMVNLEYVTALNRNRVEITGKKTMSIGKNYRDYVLNKYLELMRI